MDPKNYCRQIVTQYSADLESIRKRGELNDMEKDACEILSANLSLLRKAKKFIVPDGGYSCDDKDLRALSAMPEVRLPFPVIALEYAREEVYVPKEEGWASGRAVVVAVEVLGRILILPSAWSDQRRHWTYLGPAFLMVDQWDRSKGPEGLPFGLASTKTMKYLVDGMGYGQEDIKRDYGNEFWAVLSFLNALVCSNVTTRCAYPARPSRKKSASNAIPFDDYWVLELRSGSNHSEDQGGTHRSPREHVRRGHIRRLHDGRHIWVNATVVAAGRGFGRVAKDYALVG